ncbi:MAG: alkaline phosphatase [Bacteroidales bacterium]
MNIIKYSLIVFTGLSLFSCNTNRALSENDQAGVKNVIYMIGDGMGLAHVTAMMIEQKYEPCAFDRAEAVGLVKTFSANNRITDSAAAGTALATGNKTNNGMLGLTPGGDTIQSVLSRAGVFGKKTGIVVTCEIENATPAAFYAHVDNRSKSAEIALQLSHDSIDVLFGGGMKYFNGRDDGIDLVKNLKAKNYQVFDKWTDAIQVKNGKVAAFVAPGHLPYHDDGRGDFLPEATSKALEILTNDSQASGNKGFFMMVEGSQIDWASHGNQFSKLLHEMNDFEKSVKIAFDYADAHPGTLVVVTADHETGGLIMPSGNVDFTKSESGIDYKFGSVSHTGIMVPLFAYGKGAANFTGIFDNTDVPKIINKLLGL